MNWLIDVQLANSGEKGRQSLKDGGSNVTLNTGYGSSAGLEGSE